MGVRSNCMDDPSARPLAAVVRFVYGPAGGLGQRAATAVPVKSNASAVPVFASRPGLCVSWSQPRIGGGSWLIKCVVQWHGAADCGLANSASWALLIRRVPVKGGGDCASCHRPKSVTRVCVAR